MARKNFRSRIFSFSYVFLIFGFLTTVTSILSVSQNAQAAAAAAAAGGAAAGGAAAAELPGETETYIAALAAELAYEADPKKALAEDFKYKMLLKEGYTKIMLPAELGIVDPTAHTYSDKTKFKSTVAQAVSALIEWLPGSKVCYKAKEIALFP